MLNLQAVLTIAYDLVSVNDRSYWNIIINIMLIFVLSDRKIFQNYEAIYNLPIYAFEKFKI